MKKVTTIELMKDNVSIGHAPIIEETGKKPRMFLEDGQPVRFDTEKEDREYGKATLISYDPIMGAVYEGQSEKSTNEGDDNIIDDVEFNI